MTISIGTTIRYECRTCGWQWTRPMRVTLTPEILERAGDGDPFDRIISVPKCRGCKERENEKSEST